MDFSESDDKNNITTLSYNIIDGQTRFNSSTKVSSANNKQFERQKERNKAVT